MSPAEKRLGGAGQGFSFMVAQKWTVSRSPPQGTAWTRCSALLLVALISALQHPVQGSLTVQPDASTLDESWPPEELSSSAASEILGLYIQEEIENNTMFYNTTPTSNKVDDTSPTSSIQNNVSIQFEEPGPTESPILSSFQPTNPGLNNTSMLPLSTLHPSYNPFSTGDSFTASSLPSPPSSFPSSSSSPPYQTSSSATDVYYKSSTSPYSDKVTDEEVLTQDTAIGVFNFSSNAASTSVHITSSWEATKNGTTDLVQDNQSLESTQALMHTDPALNATREDSLGQTSNKTESSSIDATSLTLKTSSMKPIYTLPHESVVTSRSTEYEVDSFFPSNKPSTPLNTTFTTPLNTLDASSLEPHQVGTYTTIESGRITNSSTYVPMTQEGSVSSPISTEQPSTGSIEFGSIYFTDTTTVPSSEETSVEATNSSIVLSTSPSALMSSMSLTTSTPLNPSMAFISVQSSKNTEAEHTLGSSLSNEFSSNIDTNTDDKMSNITDLSTSALRSQNVMEVSPSFIPTQFNSFSEDMASQITSTVVPSTNSSLLTSITTSETPPEETSSFKTSTVTYITNTMTEMTEMGHTVDTNPMFTDSPKEKITMFPSTSMTSSTFKESTSANIELSTIALSEVASSLKTTTSPLLLDTKSENIANVTSSLETNTATMFHSHSGATLQSETPPEMSTFTMIDDTNTNTEIQQTPVKTTALPISLETTSDITLWTSNDIVTSPLEINTSTTLYLHSGATFASETPMEISTLTVMNETSTNTEIQQTSVKTTALPIPLDTTSDMELWTTNYFENITSPSETNTSTMLYPHLGTTLVSETPMESSTFTMGNDTSTNTEIQQTTVKTTALPISLNTTSDMELWTSKQFVNITSPLETNTSTMLYPHIDTTLVSETSPESSTFTMKNDTSTNTEIQQTSVKTTTLPISLNTTSDMELWTSNEYLNITSQLETNTSTMLYPHSSATLVSDTLTESSTFTVINDISTTTEIQQTSVKTTALPISLNTTSDMALWTSKEFVNITSPLETNTSTMLYPHSGTTLVSETPLESSTFTMGNDTSTNSEIQQTSVKTTTIPISLNTTIDMQLWTSKEFVNITSPLETNTSTMLYPHSGTTFVSETPLESSTFTMENDTSTNTEIQQTSVKTTTLPISLNTTSDMELWTSKEFVNITSPLETNTSTMLYPHSGTTLVSKTPPESSTFVMKNDTSTNTEIQQTSVKTTTLPISLNTTSDMELWTSNEFVNVTFPLETNTTALYPQSGATSTSETPLESSMFTMINDTSTNTEIQQTFSTVETTHKTTSSKEESSLWSTVPELITLNTLETIVKSTSNLDVSEMTSQTVTDNSSATSIITSAPELNISTVIVSTPSTGSEPLTRTSVSSAIQETSTSANSMEGNSTSYLTPYSSYMSTSSEEESSLTPTIPEPITSNLSTLETTLESTSNLHVSKIITQSFTDNSSAISDIISTPEGNTSAVVVSSQSTGSEMLTFSRVSSAIQETSTSANSMEGNGTPYSGYTTTNVLNGTGPFRPTQLKSSTTYQSSSFPTSNFDELSTYISTSSRPSTSIIEGVSVVTSTMESTMGSIEISSSNAGTSWTITDSAVETATSILPVTSRISTMLSSQSSNTNANTKEDISSPLPLSSSVATKFFRSSTQPSVSATSYMSSITQISTASDNTGSQGTIMLSSSHSTDSLMTSANSEYLTSSDGLQRTTTNSSSLVTSLRSQPATKTEVATATTLDMVNSNESTTHTRDTTVSMLHTTSHLSSTSIKSTHSSSFSPLTTTNLPTNISNSLSTVSSVLPSAEVSTVSTTGNATQNFTSTEKPLPFSSVTLTTPTTHVSPSIIYTLLTTQFTKTLGVVTTGSRPTNHTTHTAITVLLPTTSQTTTLTPPSLTTAHTPSTDTVTTVSDTTKVSTVLTHTVTSSTMASTATSPRTSVASVTTATNATIVNITTLTTMLSPSTTPSSFECKPSFDNMVKTVLTLMYQPSTKEDKETIMQTFQVFLNLTLYRALNQSIQVFMNSTTLNESSQPRNVTLGYSVSVNNSLYIPSAIVNVLTGSNVFDVAKLKLNISGLQSVPIIAEPWEPDPNISFRVKTILKIMGTGANIHTCVYVRNMEQKLQTAYEMAEFTSTGVSSNLSVQILNTSIESQILTLIYVVKNNSNAINGTTASSLLNVLSGEVVGYYLGDPPSIIAEPLYYPNIDISGSTMSYWVYTVIQGVDSQLLGANNQSFARQMEERLATLFQISSQQSRRFRRATTVGSYKVQMVKMQRLDGTNNLAELTYYALKDGQPIQGTSAAKQLSTIDPQTMALTLGYIVRVQASSVVQVPPNNLWIIAAVLAPIAVVTVIIIIITAVLCRKNKSDFKSENISNLPPRTKPVQGFDYAKQHLGQQGGDEDVLPVTQETVVPSLNLSQERDSTKDGSTEKMLKSSDNRKSRSPCENGSVISNESEDASSDRSTPQKVMAQHRVTKDEACKRNVPISDEEEGNIHFDKNKMMSDPFDSSSGSVQLIAIKPVSIPPPLTVSERNQEMSIINGEVNKALKQKSDIEHYRNKLRLKAKRKGYYDFPPIETKSLNDRKRKAYENTQMEIENALDAGTDTSSPFAEPKNRQASMKNHPYRSRQSLNSPSPGETEMDLLVTRERPRRGIRNSGYDTEPEIIEETNIDRVKQARTYIKSRQAKGHSETSTLSSQPSIDEVRQQMHMLLEEAFSLASAGHGGPKRQTDPYASVQHMPYSEVVTSAPGTMSRPRVQWVPTYGPEMYQYSLPRPNYRFSQLPEMVVGSPPPPVPPRTGPVAVPSLRRSTSDMAKKSRMPEPGGNDQGPGEHVGFPAVSRGPVPVAQTDQPVSNYSGNSMPAVFAIPGNRAGYSGYYIPQPPASYRNQAWMSYSGENDLPGQWADSVPLPGYIEAYPRSRYPQNSPSRLPRQFGQPVNLHPSLDHAAGPSIGASQQSLADTDTPDASLTNLSTAALVKAIREEVAKLAKKQTDMFEFQV